MADHLREQVLDAVVTDVTGLTTTGANVHRLRVYPQDSGALPSLNVVQGSDVNLEGDGGQAVYGYYDRVLEVTIEVRVKATSNVDQTLNLIEKEVVIALAAGTVVALTGVRRLWLVSTDAPEPSDEGAQKIARMNLHWAVEYRSQAGDPSLT